MKKVNGRTQQALSNGSPHGPGNQEVLWLQRKSWSPRIQEGLDMMALQRPSQPSAESGSSTRGPKPDVTSPLLPSAKTSFQHCNSSVSKSDCTAPHGIRPLDHSAMDGQRPESGQSLGMESRLPSCRYLHSDIFILYCIIYIFSSSHYILVIIFLMFYKSPLRQWAATK